MKSTPENKKERTVPFIVLMLKSDKEKLANLKLKKIEHDVQLEKENLEEK